MMLDLTHVTKAISRYTNDIESYKTKISSTQEDLLKDQAWIHKLEAEIQEYKESMTEKVNEIKELQGKIFGAEEAIVALTEIID